MQDNNKRSLCSRAVRRISAGAIPLFARAARSILFAIVFVAAAAPVPQIAFAQEPAVKLQRLPSPITLDGMPDEAVWQKIAPLPLTMFKPVFRGTPTQRTEVRVAYDDDYLYAAGWFYDTDPSQIRVNSLYRDRANGDDTFTLLIDAFNDNQNAKLFGTTPAGIRFDMLLSGDGSVENDSWDTFWDAKSRTTSQGWFTEMRIPLSSLGFQVVNGTATMGLTATRLISRTNERITFPAIDPNKLYTQPSVAQDVELEGVHSATPLYVTPYVLSGVQQTPVLAPNAPAYHDTRDYSHTAGLDLRYALTSQLTLDVTTNTDFAQVEADDQQVNLDRFSLFFPEKRRFFQEHSEIFDVVTGNSSRVFHSRNIGLVNGQSVPVLGGGRLVGRTGAWDVGVLDMQTGAGAGAPSENFAVARAKRALFNPYSSVGGIITSRLSDGHYNVAYGGDASVRIFGDDYVSGELEQTRDDSDSTDVAFMDRTQVHLEWQRRTRRGLWYNWNYIRSGSDYDPELGFLPRRDFTSMTGAVQYAFLPGDNSAWSRVYPGAYATTIYRHSDGALESGQLSTWFEFESKKGGDGWIEPEGYRENVAESFEIADGVTVPVGIYTFGHIWLHWTMPPGLRVRSDFDLKTGSYFDGSLTTLTLSPTWNVSPHLELGADYEGDFLRFPTRDQAADIHLLRVRIRTAIDARASGNAFVQLNSTTHRVDVNLRLRYNFAEGTDLWLVYDEGLSTDRLSDPLAVRQPLSAGRSLILKYSHTFHM